MKRVFKWLGILLSVLIVGVGALFVHVWYFKPAKIDWFYGRAFAKFALESPEMLSDLRIVPPWLDFYGDDLDDASPAGVQRAFDLTKDTYDMLRSYDRGAIDEKARLSYDALEYFLRLQIEGDAFRGYEFPVNQMFGVQSTLPNFMAETHQVTNAREAKDYLARLSKFPVKFDQVIESLTGYEAKGVIPPQFTVEKVLVQMREFAATPARQNVLYATFKEKLDKIPAGEMDAATRERFLGDVENAVNASVYPSYKKLIAHFEALAPKAQGNFGAWHLPNGDAYYAWCVRQHTTTDMKPEAIHEIGLADVARVGAEMDAILRDQGLAEGTIGDRVREIGRRPDQLFANTPEGRREMIARFQQILDEIDKGLGSAFDVRPKLGVDVRAIPEYSQATAPIGYYMSGAFDGSRPGVFYANTRDTAEVPKFIMRSLAYHEGTPGHHFQITIAQELTDLPFFRRILGFTAFAEGWGLYAERLAWELGFENDPLDNLGRLRFEMVRAVRLVVDTGIHAKKWTREQAIAYMRDNTGMAEADVVAEIERYFVFPGQALAYKIGMLKILELRERAKAALGSKFDLRQFHNQVLTNGELPLVLLEGVIDGWIARTKAG
ncbi:DUF885 domain-containing protein [Tahibacter soli]|uniref:DUF885 domain-containing protein n=1 Tax=Tahibacter soli TaxID=2983605 RepID=A0A9X3YH10_9GAMM|nr:DUF885 domain-containing protein [Tahibacter soli]MDC8012174.1 DUF885 domain-containing protein [Tahibacter soli]